MEHLILASASPRREQLLALLGVPFTIAVANVEETVDDGVEPSDNAIANARLKARAVAALHPGAVVLGADTIVVKSGRIYGKPRDEAQAIEFLRELSGAEHEVITGFVIVQSESEHASFECTKVRFQQLADSEILSYIRDFKPLDKAGAYGAQDGFAKHIKAINGCYFNVVGLPLHRVYLALQEFGL